MVVLILYAEALGLIITSLGSKASSAIIVSYPFDCGLQICCISNIFLGGVPTINKNLISSSPIKLKGLTVGMSYHLAECCSPIKGEQIVGIVTAGLGVAIHTVECETLESYSDSPERWLDVSWERDNDIDQLSISRINIILTNKTGSLGKAANVIAKNNGNIANIRFVNRKIDFFEIVIDIEVRDRNHLSNIVAALRLLSEVSSVERIKG